MSSKNTPENIFNVKIEISKSSRVKYEANKKTGTLHVDRVLFGSNVYPQNYGYIEKTLDLDNDPLDVLVISNELLIPGCIVPVRILGAMKMIDKGERDTKLIGVIDVDPRYDEIQKLTDIPKGLLDEIEDFFKNYKNLEKKEVNVEGFVGLSDALAIIQEGKKLFARSSKDTHTHSDSHHKHH